MYVERVPPPPPAARKRLSMPWSEQRAFPVDVSTPSAARQFITANLQQAVGEVPGVRAIIDTAALTISELTTNAVNANATSLTVALAIYSDHLRLSVTDNGAGMPKLRSPSLQATSGRGLLIIDQLARRWGTTPTADGKETWAELSLDPSVTMPAH
ncbi:MAG: ATP-binding protein [Actinobacteria bacterium]|nr:ATP-binding protein [Actinomycetota bacterium]